jgi:hypothetical protein
VDRRKVLVELTENPLYSDNAKRLADSMSGENGIGRTVETYREKKK